MIQIDVKLRQIESGHVKLKQLEEIPVDLSSTDIYPLFLFAKAKLVGYKNGFLAIQLLKESLAIFPDRDPDKIHLLIWYASVMHQRSDYKQEEEFLNLALKVQRTHFKNNIQLLIATNLYCKRDFFEEEPYNGFKKTFEKESKPVIQSNKENRALHF